VHSELLSPERSHFGAQVFMGVVAEGFYIWEGAPYLSFVCWMKNGI
jgi:hypothetical protein